VKGTLSENDRKQYSQAVLSGWGANLQSGKESSDNPQSNNQTVGEVPAKFWEQKQHILFIPVVIKQVELSNSEYQCEISIPLDVDVPVRVHRARSEKMSQFTTYILKEKVQDKTPPIRMVSRISEEGVNPLSPIVDADLGQILAYVYSRVLGFSNRAVRCFVHESQDQKNNVNEGVSSESPSTPKDLGEHTKGGRSKEVRGKIRLEKGAKDSS